jgi:hypothetical protein
MAKITDCVTSKKIVPKWELFLGESSFSPQVVDNDGGWVGKSHRVTWKA